ncbi:MAG: precorrin-2 C(20)-methyltransferase [Deltaproteobacteria bacterium]|nr:precorrin-2 C(20)-methyltransferase [Deltaproteobacteria bacterium]
MRDKKVRHSPPYPPLDKGGIGGGTRAGVFYGIGAGPGDPELITIKALRLLNEAPVIAVPAGAKKESSGRALKVIERLIDLNAKEVIELFLPMTRDGSALKEAREKAAGEVVKRLEKGLDVAFVTLGDPMIYSTFGSIARLVEKRQGSGSVMAIPGVTSFSTAAADALLPLAVGDESIAIVSKYPGERFKEMSAAFDTLVILKVNRDMARLADELKNAGFKGKVFFASELGWPEEFKTWEMKSALKKDRGYFSLIIVKK